MKYKYNFSFIIPHKNVPDLLVRCVNSIPQRDDIEVIIVDDNSKSDIVDNFPIKDSPNVSVIFTKEGLGAGHARNVGLNNSSGKWIIFADSDDFFTDGINTVIEKVLNSEYELYVFETCSVLSDTLKPTHKRVDGIEGYKKTYDESILRYCTPNVWGKVFSRDLIVSKGMPFDEEIAANDVKVSVKCGINAKNVLFLPYISYCCTVRGGSISTKHDLAHTDARFKVHLQVIEVFKEANVPSRYMLNLLGPVFDYLHISKSKFIKALFLYVKNVPFQRRFLDAKESGSRLIQRIFHLNKDQEMRDLYNC